jgi:hypothetical protein
MVGIGARHAHANLARFTIKPDLLTRVHLAHDVLLDLELEHTVIHADLHLLMRLHTRATHGLLTLDALGGGLPLPLIHRLANVTVRDLRGLFGDEQLVEAADEEVVVELAHATARYHGLLAAYGTGELAVVGVLVGALRVDMLLDALLAECVQARETLGVLVVFEADFASEELVVDLLG